jgi:molybdenum cofactor biosynthesis enzyme MoaA
MSRLGRLPLPSEEVNPYIEAFWRIFPKLYSELKVLRITGGEPLLNENTFKLIDYLKNHSHSELEFSVNTMIQLLQNHMQLQISINY